MERHTHHRRQVPHRPVQHRGRLSRPELLLAAPGRVAAGYLDAGNGLARGGWRSCQADRHPGDGRRGPVRLPPLQLGEDGLGRPAAPAGQRSRHVHWTGPGTLHPAGNGEVGLHPGGHRLPADAGADAGPAGGARASACFGKQLGRVDLEPAPGGRRNRAESAAGHRPGPGSTQPSSGVEADVRRVHRGVPGESR